MTIFGLPFVQLTLFAVILATVCFLGRHSLRLVLAVMLLVPLVSVGLSINSANADTVISASENWTPPASPSLMASFPPVYMPYLIAGIGSHASARR